MCTVTLIPKQTQNSFILTFNRDEAKDRVTFSPSFEEYQGTKLLFPKDGRAGGTWIGISAYKRVIGLLNGGFVNHKRQLPYRKSRGIIVKDWLACENIDREIKQYNLNNIEPFTLIIADWQKDLRFIQVVWDGQKKHVKNLPLQSHIWSSSPLYSSEMKTMREKWFEDFRNSNDLTSENLWEFHHTAGENDKNTDLIMDRNFVKTQSISQIISSEEISSLKYEDLKSSEINIKFLENDYFIGKP